MVVSAIGTLCETANAALQGNATEERIIASAKGVASSTAQLLLASRVKADANSQAQRNLQVSVHFQLLQIRQIISWPIPKGRHDFLADLL